MIDRDTILAASLELVDATRRSEDYADGDVADLTNAASSAMGEWQANGWSLKDCEPVLQACDALLNRLHALNDEGLPLPVKDPSARMLVVLDECAGQGFAINGDAAPAARL